MPSYASLASAVKPASPVTRVWRPSASGPGSRSRRVSTLSTTTLVFSSVVAIVTSALEPSSDTCDGGVSGARLAPRSPHAMPRGVTIDLRSGIARESHSARICSSIAWKSASVSGASGRL